jgi:D-glycero-D-manno-heptose 1,7-bisphosphate phosphatase
MSRPALFLDRDGTLIEHVPYLSDPSGVKLLPGVPTALKKAQEAGFALFLHTNQSGVGRGYFTLAEAEACNRRLLELLDLVEPFVEVKLAPEAPSDPVSYRKPSPRFILESIKRYDLDPACCFMIGDNRADVEAGHNARIRSLALRAGAGSKEEAAWEAWLAENNVPVFDDFPAAVDFAIKSLNR